MELVKGRWYKNLGEKRNHIGRFSGWYDPETISVSEYIYEGKLRGASDCFTGAYKFAKECNLSEIQQYLPDGHPDKEYVLKTKEMEEKEIIGYKLKEDCEQFREAALKLSNTVANWENSTKPYDINITQERYIKRLKEAKVFDLWFEPIFKEKFRVGDWVTWSNGVTGRIVNHCKSFADSWSLDVKGDLKEYSSCSEKWLRLATSKEIKKTLVEEAIKRGFKGGVKIDKTPLNYSGTAVWTLSSYSSGFIYEPSRDELQWSASQDIVYRNGKWAEILPNYPQIEINGYKGEFFDNYVKFGCAEIHYQDFIEINNCINVFGDGTITNKYIESITIGKGTFSKEQIKLIAYYYLNKK